LFGQGSAWLASWGGHGGLDKALCLFDAGVLAALQKEGHPIQPGSIGEQLLIDGLNWGDHVRTGAVLLIGRSLLLEITEPSMPCGTIRGSFAKGNNSVVDARKHPACSRWYARVLSPGWVSSGDEVQVLGLPTMTAAEAVADVARKLKKGEPILPTGPGTD
jgi:MOSC domain-containing protein YiiM